MRVESDSWRFGRDPAFVERECLLFEAGEYADRNMTITADDLRQIAANTPVMIPVKIEHLHESPFDGVLGVVTRVRAIGNQLWGTLRQPVEAWRFVQKAGARALSIALDIAGQRLTETSFVCRPRVARAQVFGGNQAVFHTEALFEGAEALGAPGKLTIENCQLKIANFRDSKEEDMFGEALIRTIRAATGTGESAEGDPFAEERAELEAQRETLRGQQVEQQIAEFKRQGLIRASDSAVELARAILRFGDTFVTRFGEQEVPLGLLFARFLRENGAVVPMGEFARADPLAGLGASDRLIALARDKSRDENTSYVAAFGQVAHAHPELARAARDEAFSG